MGLVMRALHASVTTVLWTLAVEAGLEESFWLMPLHEVVAAIRRRRVN